MKLKKITQKGMRALQLYLEKHRNTADIHIDITSYESKEVQHNDRYIEIDNKKSFTDKFSVGKYFFTFFS